MGLSWSLPTISRTPHQPQPTEREKLVASQESTSDRFLGGRCQCGAVRYTVADEFVYAANCHCSNCRQATGSAFKPFAGIERDKLRITSGGDKLMTVGDESGNDTRCQVCGSLLYSVVRDGTFVHVAMGTLVDDPTVRPTSTSSSVPRRGGSQSATTYPSTRNMR
jgi:hypothetical protein